MKRIIIWILIICISCSDKVVNKKANFKLSYTENEILEEIDLAYNGTPNLRYPIGKEGDIKYAIFLDLEHGYCETAKSRIHLYADEKNWAIVLEKSGYQNRGSSADIELNYVGNCIEYPINNYPERNYITNTKNVYLITPKEFERIENKSGTDMEKFELIDKSITEIQIRDSLIKVELNSDKYEKLGIELREYDNPNKLIGFGELIRYFTETSPKLISATETEIKSQLPINLQKLMTIDEFHHLSAYEEERLPSQIETYQLIAKILVNKDPQIWKPKLKPNNHWSNWESGHL